MEHVARLIKDRTGCSVKTAEPLSRHTSFGIGGPADLFVEPHTVAELITALRLLHEECIPYYFLGNGTNLLVGDKGVCGAVVRLRGEFARYHYDGETVVSGAAVPLALLAKDTCREGFINLAFASGIPGSLGGALYMNAGAHGSALGDFVLNAVILDRDLVIQKLSRQDLNLAYRKSGIPHGSVICSVRLQLEPGDRDSIGRKCREYLVYRQNRQPSQPNAGSVFKNPPQDTAGRLLDAAGLKGSRLGDAMISEVHANFIVNCGSATAADVLALIEFAQKVVYEKFGVRLEMEIQKLGD